MPRVYTGRAISERCQAASYLRGGGRVQRAATVDVRLAVDSTCEASSVAESRLPSISSAEFVSVPRGKSKAPGSKGLLYL